MRIEKSLTLGAESALEVVDVVVGEVAEEGRVAAHGQGVAGVVVASEHVEQRHARGGDTLDENICQGG